MSALLHALLQGLLAVLELFLTLLERRDIDEGDDYALDIVLRGAIRTKTKHIPAVLRFLDFTFDRDQLPQNLFCIIHKAAVVQLVGQMIDGTISVRWHNIDDVADAGSETPDAQFTVEEKGSNFRGSQEIFKFLLGTGKLLQLHLHVV